MKNKKIGNVTQWDDEMLERLDEASTRIDPDEELKDDCCGDDQHFYILINKRGRPQCATCLQLYDTWEAVRVALERVYRDDEKEFVDKRIQQLKRVARQVISGRPPKEEWDFFKGSYLTSYGYQDIHRLFYDSDSD